MSKKSDCWRTKLISAPCQVCGARAEPIHSPLRLRGFWCEKHCPICSAAEQGKAKNSRAAPGGPNPDAGQIRASDHKATPTCCGRELP